MMGSIIGVLINKVCVISEELGWMDTAEKPSI